MAQKNKTNSTEWNRIKKELQTQFTKMGLKSYFVDRKFIGSIKRKKNK